MKKALVLCGGGSRGAYEVGALKALHELGHEFDLVVGTSIGAINGAFVVMDDYEGAENFWRTITVDDVMVDGINLKFDMDKLFSQKEKIKPFLKNYLTNKGADITPFKNTIRKLVDEEKIRSSKIDFGIVTLQVPKLVPVERLKEDIQYGQLVDYIIASASCFPAFPVYKINDTNYIDGRYYDNLPINFAIKQGATELVVIDLNYNAVTHPESYGRPNIDYIVPSWDLGLFLDFEKTSIEKNLQLGYNDTLKFYKKRYGYRYTFLRPHHQNKLNSLGEKYLQMIALLESYIPEKNSNMILKLINKSILTNCIKESTNNKTLSFLDYAIRGSEIVMEILEYNPVEEYKLSNIHKQIQDDFRNLDETEYQTFLMKLKDSKLPKGYIYIKSIESKKLICNLIRLMEEKENLDLVWYATLTPKELCAALYIIALKK